MYRIPWRWFFWSALGVITFLALMPWSRELPQPFQLSDKLNHFAAFIVLSWLMHCAYPRLRYLMIVVVLVGYGALIEGVQYFLPWRSADWRDLAIDALATTLGSISIWIIERRFRLERDLRLCGERRRKETEKAQLFWIK